MSNISHAVLAGTEIHEPKGVASATSGQVYVADGLGSGNWTGIGTSNFTGQIADFAWLVPQSGWLECDGSDINTTTYGALFNVMTTQTTGTKTNGSGVIGGIPTTANMRVGYYILMGGFGAGVTIVSVDSANQITVSAAAVSGGTTLLVVSPWYMATGTIRLPNLAAGGLFRRARSGGTPIGSIQATQNLSHSHLFSGTSGVENLLHTHTGSGITGGMNASNPHNHGVSGGTVAGTGGVQATSTTLNFNTVQGPAAISINASDINHGHAYSFTTSPQSIGHNHPFAGNTNPDGSSESRPPTMVLMTCVKT